MGNHFHNMDVLYYIAMFISIGAVGILQQRFSENLRKQAVKNALEANVHEVAVKTDEVKKLAENSRLSTKEIGGILNEIQNKTEKSVKKMNKSKVAIEKSEVTTRNVEEAFTIITSNNGDIVSRISMINTLIGYLRESISSINHNISRLSSTSEQNQGSISNLSLNINEMDNMIKQINSDFKELQEKTRSL